MVPIGLLPSGAHTQILPGTFGKESGSTVYIGRLLNCGSEVEELAALFSSGGAEGVIPEGFVVFRDRIWIKFYSGVKLCLSISTIIYQLYIRQ